MGGAQLEKAKEICSILAAETSFTKVTNSTWRLTDYWKSFQTNSQKSWRSFLVKIQNVLKLVWPFLSCQIPLIFSKVENWFSFYYSRDWPHCAETGPENTFLDRCFISFNISDWIWFWFRYFMSFAHSAFRKKSGWIYTPINNTINVLILSARANNIIKSHVKL